jgi:hypothetical protein
LAKSCFKKSKIYENLKDRIGQKVASKKSKLGPNFLQKSFYIFLAKSSKKGRTATLSLSFSAGDAYEASRL